MGRRLFALLSVFLTSHASTLAGFLPTGPKWMTKVQGMFAEALPQDVSGNSCLAADELVKRRGANNYREAVKQYKELLAKDPTNDDIKYKLAETSVLFLRAATNANAVMIDGISDSPENRAIWREYAPPAYGILKEFNQANPEDAKTWALMTEAFTYGTSAKGILGAAVKGDGFTFMKYVDRFIKKHPTFDGGVAYIYKGAFLLAAPWPVRDIKGAREAFGNALKVEPASRRNNYYAGVSAYHAGDYPAALQSFEQTLVSESVAMSEVDVGEFFLREAKRGAEASKDKLKLKQ